MQHQHNKHLSNPVNPIVPSEHPGADGLLAAFSEISFQARNLGFAADLLTQMVSEKGVFKVLTLAGALVPGGMSATIREMIEHRRYDSDAYRGIVLAAEGWHAGVIGIVASRLKERFNRPALVVALENGLGSEGDSFVVTAGVPFHEPGTTNYMRIETL